MTASENQSQTAKSGGDIVHHKIISAKMRFDFSLPADVPKENGDAYAKERLRHICSKLNAMRGVEVSYILDD